MTTKLRPLILPQLVENRINACKKHDDVQCTVDAIETGNGSLMFLGDNASVSDITSPATPTFSQRSGLGHIRYASSTSSLELALSSPPTPYADCTSNSASGPGFGLLPAASALPPASNVSTPKRVLPDVQEEDPFEQTAEDVELDHHHADEDDGEDFEAMILSHRVSDLYDCLCDEPCTHGRADREPVSFDSQRPEYDLGFGSESDMTPTNPPFIGRPRRRTNGGSTVSSEAGTERSFAGLSQRIGSHMNVLSRWRSGSTSSRRAYGNLTTAPVSDPSLSHAPSSRASSLSTGRPAMAELFSTASNTNPVIIAPSNSRHNSTDSIERFPSMTGAMDDDDDAEFDDTHQNIERDRAKATTPLLPPLFISTPHPSASPLPPPSINTSPHLAPNLVLPAAVADSGIPPMSLVSLPPPSLSHPSSPIAAMTATDVLPSPLLNRKYSTASFQHGHLGSNAPAVASALEPQDEWADRLGHANQTISPRPYRLHDTAGPEDFYQLCHDWAEARANYAKHLVRMGEHYGTTSKIYVLTEAKWAETECQWRAAHTEGYARTVAQQGPHKAPLCHHQEVSAVIPQIVDTEGKFPHRGDDEIVGPMDRVERHGVPTHEKRRMSKFLRGLAGRVRMRR